MEKKTEEKHPAKIWVDNGNNPANYSASARRAMEEYSSQQNRELTDRCKELEGELNGLRKAVLSFAKADWINEEQTPDFKNAWDNLTETAGVFYSYPAWQLKGEAE